MGVSGESLISILSHAPNSELDQALPSSFLGRNQRKGGWAEERNQNQTGKEGGGGDDVPESHFPEGIIHQRRGERGGSGGAAAGDGKVEGERE